MITPLVNEPIVEKRLVVVAEVSESVDPVALVNERAVVVALVKNPLVNEPLVAKRLVEVAEVSERTVPVPLVKARLPVK